MYEQLKLLVKVQSIDYRIEEISLEKEKKPVELQKLERNLEISHEDFNKIVKKEKDLQKKRREIELDLDEIAEKVKKSKKRLLEVKTNKEYQALLKEIEERERLRLDKEDQVLDILEEIEKLTNEIAGKSRALAAMKEKHEKEKVELDRFIGRLEGQLTGLATERKSVVMMIKPHLMERYNFIKERRNGTAVVAVRNAICQACHMNIPPQTYNELQRGDQIMTCPNCQRIIYWGNEQFI